MTTGLPTLVPEVAFATTPADPAPTWVNVLADFRSGSTNRGRQRELDRYQAGTMDMVLNNRGRTYDPEYAAGTYAPNVKPMRRTRLRATWNAVTYPIFDGYTDKWDQDYQQPREATATLRATDGFKVLTKSNLSVSATAAEIFTDGPHHWWRLGEPAGSTTILDAGLSPATPGTATGVTFGTAGITINDSNTAATFPNTPGNFIKVPFAGVARPLTVEAWFRATTAIPGGSIIFSQVDNLGGTFRELVFGIATAGVPGAAFIGETSDPANAVAGTTTLTDGAPHHIAATISNTGLMTLYVDGVSQGTPTTSAVIALAAAGTVYLGNRYSDTATYYFSGDLADVAVYDTALSAARVAAHSAAGHTAWSGDTPAARITRILDLASWPAALRNLDTGSSTLQSATLAMTALDHAQKVADSEFGELFITRDGKVRLIGRTGLLNRAISATFGDGGGSERAYSAIGFDNGDLLIRTPVTVSRTGGVAQTSSDATGITNYLNHQFTLDGLYHNSDTLSKDAADFLVSEYKDPKSRVTTLVVEPQRDPTNLWPIVLAAELGDVFTVIRRPQGVGAAISQNCEIQGIKHDIRPGHWTVTFTLSPAYTGAFLQLDLVSGPGLDSLRLYF